MEPDGPATAGQVALDFHIRDHDGLTTRDADPAGPLPKPRHAAMLFRESTSQDLLPNPEPQVIGLAHVVTLLFLGLEQPPRRVETDPDPEPEGEAIS
jgi:hypothetical protein